jgi:CheY-like chemotaxis protein
VNGTGSSSSSGSSPSNHSGAIQGGVRPVTLTPLEESVPSFEALQAIQCGSLRVKVSDTGVGIEEHNKDKLFHQFQQFDKNQLQAGGGSGLGLWISHYIVDCHGGKLQFESLGPGKGSVFFFDLPLYRQESSVCPQLRLQLARSPTKKKLAAAIKEDSPACALELEKAQSEATADPKAAKDLKASAKQDTPEIKGLVPNTLISEERKESLGASQSQADSHPRPHNALLKSQSSLDQILAPVRVDGNGAPGSADGTTTPKQVAFLLVDDSKGNRRMLRRMLESDKSILVSSIQEAEDGVDAIKIVAEAGSAPDKPPIDCIFMDSVMREMHGPETVKHLRSKLGFTGKILGLTGNAMEDDVKHFQQAGLDLLLIKPLRKVGLLEALAAQELMPTQQAPTHSDP